ncbi:MAG: 50S ribosomal protein L16 [Candidatus Diapherotrites archaeon]|nr:50S ribosomal protein L16 [Candidatus Diapherotrites archaeon]
MALRPAHCYRKLERPYTRIAISVHRKNYIGGVPGLRVRQFNMGNPQRKYKFIVNLIAEEAVQIRENALEAVRMLINRALVKKLGKDNFFMRLRIFPHHVMRENKQAQGAGADRVSQGMSLAFGKAIGRAARVRKGTIIFSVLVLTEGNAKTAARILKKASAKLPCKVSVDIGEDVKSIGTLPKRMRIIEEEKEEEAEAEEEKKEEEAEKEEKAEEGEKESKEKEGTKEEAKEEKQKEEKEGK